MRSFVVRFIPKGRIGKSVLILMSGTAAAQALTALSLPVVTRLYTPEMIGVISIYLSFFNFWNSTLTWRYEGALLLSEDEQESHQVFRIGATLTVIMSLLSIPVLIALNRYDFLGFGILPKWTPIVAFISLLGFGWFMMYRSWALRLQKVELISLATISRSAVNSLTRVATGFASGNVAGLFVAEILGSWSALIPIRRKVESQLQLSPVWSFASLKETATKYKKFARYEMPSTVVNQLAIALPVPMVGALYGAQAAGWFGLAILLYAIPNTQIGKSVGDVFQMELGICVRESKVDRGLVLFKRFSLKLLFVGLIVLALVVVFAPPLAPIVFGSDWAPVGLIAIYIAPWMCAALVVGSMSRALSVLQKQEWKLVYDLIYLLIVITIFLWSKYSDVESMDFILTLSLSMVGAYSIYFLIIYHAFTTTVKQQKINTGL